MHSYYVLVRRTGYKSWPTLPTFFPFLPHQSTCLYACLRPYPYVYLRLRLRLRPSLRPSPSSPFLSIILFDNSLRYLIYSKTHFDRATFVTRFVAYFARSSRLGPKHPRFASNRTRLRCLRTLEAQLSRTLPLRTSPLLHFDWSNYASPLLRTSSLDGFFI
jgi:hypothetical protein